MTIIIVIVRSINVLKKITAMKARQNLGQIMNEVAIKEDDYIIERAGKPMVAIIPIEKYRRFEEEKNEFFNWVDTVRERTKDISQKEIQEAVNEATAAVKNAKK